MEASQAMLRKKDKKQMKKDKQGGSDRTLSHRIKLNNIYVLKGVLLALVMSDLCNVALV